MRTRAGTALAGDHLEFVAVFSGGVEDDTARGGGGGGRALGGRGGEEEEEDENHEHVEILATHSVEREIQIIARLMQWRDWRQQRRQCGGSSTPNFRSIFKVIPISRKRRGQIAAIVVFKFFQVRRSLNIS